MVRCMHILGCSDFHFFHNSWDSPPSLSVLGSYGSENGKKNTFCYSRFGKFFCALFEKQNFLGILQKFPIVSRINQSLPKFQRFFYDWYLNCIKKQISNLKAVDTINFAKIFSKEIFFKNFKNSLKIVILQKRCFFRIPSIQHV
jgi:hypothetical protein